MGREGPEPFPAFPAFPAGIKIDFMKKREL